MSTYNIIIMLTMFIQLSVNMQHIYIIMLHVNMIRSHVEIVYVNIIIMYVEIIYRANVCYIIIWTYALYHFHYIQGLLIHSNFKCFLSSDVDPKSRKYRKIIKISVILNLLFQNFCFLLTFYLSKTLRYVCLTTLTIL